MQRLILDIRNQLNVSQDDLAKMIGVSFATVNRWENGHSNPNKAMQIRLYDICKEKGVDLEDIIQKKIESATLDITKRPGRLILYHG